MEIDNLNNGLIELLYKKYSINLFESSSYKLKSISKECLKNNINYDKYELYDIIDDYIICYPKLCNYDIDILNILIKIIIENRKLKKYIHRNMDFYDKLLDFFGYCKPIDPNKSYRKSIDYFIKSHQKLNNKIKYIYLNISKNIILKYSY